jgi:hypothetical protein
MSPPTDDPARRVHLPGFKALPRRWVAERAFAWMTRWRWLVRDYEQRIDVSKAMIYVARGSAGVLRIEITAIPRSSRSNSISNECRTRHSAAGGYRRPIGWREKACLKQSAGYRICDGMLYTRIFSERNRKPKKYLERNFFKRPGSSAG